MRKQLASKFKLAKLRVYLWASGKTDAINLSIEGGPMTKFSD